jgi:hypothetical protein
MPRVALVTVALAAATLAACGTSNQPSGPTVASVAVQPGDLPAGMTKCDLTGDIARFIQKEQTPDPQAAKTMTADWQDAKKNGASTGYAALYTDSNAHCAGIKTSGADLGAATYRLVVNFVVQYKDENRAAIAYKSGQPILGFNPSDLRGGGGGVVEGTRTGLTANSIALTQPAGNQLFYIALWQNGPFVVILAVLNVDANAAKNVAMRENGRIR